MKDYRLPSALVLLGCCCSPSLATGAAPDYAPREIVNTTLEGTIESGAGLMARSGSFKLFYDDDARTSLIHFNGQLQAQRNGSYRYTKISPNVGVIDEEIAGYPAHLTTTLTFTGTDHGDAVASFTNGVGTQYFSFRLRDISEDANEEPARVRTPSSSSAATDGVLRRAGQEARSGPLLPNILTEPEREYYRAFGIISIVDGERVARAGDVSKLVDIVGKIEGPLRLPLQVISDRMNNRGDEQRYGMELQRASQRLNAAVKAAAVQRIVSGGSSLSDMVTFANDLIKGGEIANLWTLQRQMLEIDLESRKVVDEAQSQAFAILGKRAPSDSIPAGFGARLIEVDGKIAVVLRTGDARIGEALVQLSLHRKTTPGQWTMTNMLSGLGLSALGVDSLDAATQIEGTRLAKAQEAAQALPMAVIVLVEGVHDHSQVAILSGVPVTAAAQLDHVSLRVVSSAGSVAINEVPGLRD